MRDLVSSAEQRLYDAGSLVPFSQLVPEVENEQATLLELCVSLQCRCSLEGELFFRWTMTPLSAEKGGEYFLCPRLKFPKAPADEKLQRSHSTCCNSRPAKMLNRDGSPALSENEFDISRAIFGGSDDSDNDAFGGLEAQPTKPPPAAKPEDGDFGLDDGDDSGSEDEDFIAAQQAVSNRKSSNLKGKTVKKGGGFQAMGLNATLLKAITRKGFSVPTPIQRKAIPVITDGQDVVGMARTGSGKTAAFVIPMIEKLKTHSAKVGARGAIMSPSRELALQTLRVVKELSRGTDLRVVLLVGGDSLEEQFSALATNPDIIIATPGRFLHLKVEMDLDLSSIKYMVFDEADRLFEMGFAAQLTEILHALPASRQTLLFSATLPKSLVEFARAGLQEPTLIRLDAESKMSPDLQSAFFTIKSAEKEGALLHVLQDVIKVPTGPTEAALKAKEPQNGASRNGKSKKRKRDAEDSKPNSGTPTEFSTIIFAATKHHVEYLTTLLRAIGYAVSHVYGALDQIARKMQVEEFRNGLSHILVVTDVAARGIDMPILANVINYDFPSQPKIFIHRVGRTARAGGKGWSYSLLRDTDMPYLLDLQLFLSRKLVIGNPGEGKYSFAEDVVVGGLPRTKLGKFCEEASKVVEEDEDLFNLRAVAAKGEKLYKRTRNSASSESAKRGREILAQAAAELNPLFKDETNDMEIEREKMLARLSGFRPPETIFEVGKKGTNNEAANIMRQRRAKIDPKRQKDAETVASEVALNELDVEASKKDSNRNGQLTLDDLDDEEDDVVVAPYDNADDDDDEMEITMTHPSGAKNTGAESWQDPEHFMSYAPKSINLVEDRGYGVQSGGYNNNFTEAARGMTMDLTNDESKGFQEATKARGLRWDKKSKNYVARANDEDGSKGSKMIRGESGQKIAASFRSGRFDAWRKSNKITRLPRTGEQESNRLVSAHNKNGGMGGGRRFHHHQEKAPKEADKYRDDYHVRKKRVEEAKEKRIGKYKDGYGAKSELRSAQDIQKERNSKDKRKEKNGRPTKKKF